ncbi:RNA polymerase sigma factor [Inhella sp.]|uniref:RNA polymerase sigma factor n=1 Tax=Inhella sp. TaxID=1921806 RepID=UPI0035AF59FF
MIDAELHQRFARDIAAHRGILFKLAFSYGPRGDERADLIQDMLLQLWHAYPRFEPGRVAFSTWMYRVAMNVAISAHRQRSRHVAEHLPLEELGLDIAEAERFWDARSDNLRTLDRLIAALDELSRALILLFLDGRETEEIAAILGLSPSNVTTRLSRLKTKLQAQFAAGSAKENTP